MDTKTIATELVALCNAGQNMTVLEKHYSPDIVSYEVDEPKKVTRGIEAVKSKGNWWFENHEVHSGVTRGPLG